MSEKSRRGKGALIKTAVAMLVLFAMLVSEVPYSLMRAVGLDDIPTEVYAEDFYTSLKNTTTPVTFDGKQWYLIDYDNSTVTLLSRECVGASKFDSNGLSNIYSGSTVETYVNDWYTNDNNISADAKTAVSGSGAFLLTTQQANTKKMQMRSC